MADEVAKRKLTSQPVEAFGRTIQLFLVGDTLDGLTIASIHGWTGSVLVTEAEIATMFALSQEERELMLLSGKQRVSDRK